MESFRVVSSFDINEIICTDLKTDLAQLAVILYPSDVFNEKFLIKMRDCVLKLGDDHPLKQWLKWVSATQPLSSTQQEKSTFLLEIVNSQFNLITDQKAKNKIIEVISAVPEKTLYEKLLKSQLYLIIGNVTRSDRILKDIINQTPLVNWKGYTPRTSLYHRIARDNFKQIMTRLGRHPADRKVFNLFCLYLKNYFNDPLMIQAVGEIELTSLSQRMNLLHTELIAPSFVQYVRLSRQNQNKQIIKLRDQIEFPVEMQMYWVWPFLDIDPVISQSLVMELNDLHEKDLLWFIYLMDNEKLADTYTSKSGKSFLPGRRHFLRSQLNVEENFMMSLYKLIELGDVDQELVRKTLHFLSHE